MDHVLTLIDVSCIDLDVNGFMSRGVIVICIYEYGSMSFSWIDVMMTHYCLVMVVQMDEHQSGPLMVKSLTRRCFVVNSKGHGSTNG
jgi:hypothetical protein